MTSGNSLHLSGSRFLHQDRLGDSTARTRGSLLARKRCAARSPDSAPFFLELFPPASRCPASPGSSAALSPALSGAPLKCQLGPVMLELPSLHGGSSYLPANPCPLPSLLQGHVTGQPGVAHRCPQARPATVSSGSPPPPQMRPLCLLSLFK